MFLDFTKMQIMIHRKRFSLLYSVCFRGQFKGASIYDVTQISYPLSSLPLKYNCFNYNFMLSVTKTNTLLPFLYGQLSDQWNCTSHNIELLIRPWWLGGRAYDQIHIKNIELLHINTMSCPIIFNSITIELTVPTYCYCGFRLTLCYQSTWKNLYRYTLVPLHSQTMSVAILCL